MIEKGTPLMTGVFVASRSHAGFPCLQFYGRLQYARMSNAQMKATHESNSYNDLQFPYIIMQT